MSKISQNKNSNSDEIDLLDLFRRMGRTLTIWGAALGHAFLISVVFLLRRWLPLIISLVLAVGCSYILKMTVGNVFTSHMVIRSNAMHNSDMIAYINRLHNFCEEENYRALEDALSFKPEMIKNILDISAFWFIDRGADKIPDYVDIHNSHSAYDTINVRMLDRLDIRAKIRSPKELFLLQNGIISFINKDSLFQQKNRLRLRQNKGLLARLDYDILQLDSLQKVKYFEETRSRKPLIGGQMVFLQEQKTQLLYDNIYDLYSRKQVLESNEDLYPDIVTLLSGFDLPAKQDNGTLYYSKKIVPLFLGIALVLLIFLANRKKLKEIYNKY